ncbi:MAG: methyltransferase dimerization domain-containing protein [Gemmataceae bacterium]
MDPKTPSTNGDYSPQQLMQMGMSYDVPRVLAAGVQLRVFSHIASGKHRLADIAQAAEASERGTRMLLDALTALRLLTKKDGQYHLTPSSERYLVRDSPEYMGAMWEDDTHWQSWGNLVPIIRSGEGARHVEDKEEAETFFPTLIRTLHVLNREPAQQVATILGAGGKRCGFKVVDVACGSGVWGIAFAEADPQAVVTMQDFSGVLEHTRDYVQRHGVDQRCNYLPGDLKQVDFGEHRFDVALLGNIVHSEGEKSMRDLFRRLHRALQPNGRIVVIDMIPNDERDGPPYPVLFALVMLLHTSAGDTYTLAEYRQWLNEAGFERVETADIGSHSPIILGTKN